MGDQWFYASGEARQGPVDLEALRRLRAAGQIGDLTQVWKAGVEQGMPLGTALDMAPRAGDRPRSFWQNVGAKLSAVAGVPEIGDVPVQRVLTDGFAEKGPIEDVFIAGTSTTTPPLSAVPSGWPRPRVWWRILLGAVATYALLRLGISAFENPRFLPGLVVVGSFVVPLGVLVFFYEMNAPRNVSVYQVGRMTLFGGALALIVTMVLSALVPGAGILPALVTGVVEESAKALALVLVLRETRWRWQLNGLLFGAAVGAGFAGFESAGYAWSAPSVYSNILWRALLSPGGHVIWTALIGAALWEVRGTRPFEWRMLVHRKVLHRWGVAVVLHALWNVEFFARAWLLQYAVLLVVGWYLVFAVFKGALHELAQAKQEAAVAPTALRIEV